MKIPNNKNIILFLNNRERKSKPPIIIDGIFSILQGLLLIATKAMSLFMLTVMSIRYTFRGNNLKFITSILLEKFQLSLLEVLNFLSLLSRKSMIFLLLGMFISPLR